jgi:hypothetical protein
MALPALPALPLSLPALPLLLPLALALSLALALMKSPQLMQGRKKMSMALAHKTPAPVEERMHLGKKKAPMHHRKAKNMSPKKALN